MMADVLNWQTERWEMVWWQQLSTFLTLKPVSLALSVTSCPLFLKLGYQDRVDILDYIHITSVVVFRRWVLSYITVESLLDAVTVFLFLHNEGGHLICGLYFLITVGHIAIPLL